MKGVTVDNILYIMGEKTWIELSSDWYLNSGGLDGISYRDEVLSWTEEGWVEVGKMKMARSDHAVSTIIMEEEVMEFCLWTIVKNVIGSYLYLSLDKDKSLKFPAIIFSSKMIW